MKPKPTKKRNWPRTVREVLLLCFSVALIYMLFAPGKDISFYPVTLADLKGVWTTPYPKYQDRFLQFDDGTITFGWGAEGMGSYTIDNIGSESDEDGTLVHVRYHDLAATPYQFNFFYADKSGGLIWMKKQKGIYWFLTNDQPIHHPTFK
jgi:hypothetical protein